MSWPHLKGLINALLMDSQIEINYLTSDKKDPGFEFNDDRLHKFFIGDGHIRNWLFENIQTDVFVMSTPDLGRFQLKRSKHPVHYVYLQHSLVSLHMAYREGSFTYFDTVCCSGPHQLAEIHAIRAVEGLPPANHWLNGYSRIDELWRGSVGLDKNPSVNNGKTHYLLAPSWGDYCLLESGVAETVIADILEAGHTITLRAHPQTKKLTPSVLRRILNKFDSHPCFRVDSNTISSEALFATGCLITDWSGIAMEYALGLLKPVVFVDGARKINNHQYKNITLEPVEVALREELGHVVSNVKDVTRPEHLSVDRDRLIRLRQRLIYNFGKSDTVTANLLVSLLRDIKVARND